MFLVLPMLLAACAHAPQQEMESANMMEAAHEQFADSKLVLPQLELNDQMLYEFMLADIAAQRGQPELAAQVYLDLAKSTRDPRVARRAAQLAYESRQMPKALEAFQLWQEVEPTSQLAKQMLATLLVSGGRLEEAQPQIAAMLAADPENAGRALMQLYPLFARNPDKAATYRSLRELTKPYAQ